MLTPLEKLLVSALTNLEGIANRYGGEHPRHDLLHAATAEARFALSEAEAQERKPAHRCDGISAYIVELTSGFIACACETYTGGFTNHKVMVRQVPEGWEIDHAGQRPVEIVRDTNALMNALRFGCTLADPHDAAAYRAAVTRATPQTPHSDARHLEASNFGNE